MGLLLELSLSLALVYILFQAGRFVTKQVALASEEARKLKLENDAKEKENKGFIDLTGDPSEKHADLDVDNEEVPDPKSTHSKDFHEG